MSRRISIVLSCGALALGGAVAAGCGSDNTSDNGAAATNGATPAQTQTQTQASNNTAPGTINVVMQNNQFAPHTIKVKVGQKIHWVNNDPYPHNVTATKGDDLKSDNINGGGTFDYTADKPGRIDYVCTIHSGQSGTIVVTG
jgi:plastocyanin